MTLSLTGFNVLAWTLQTAALLVCGLALPAVLRVRSPSVRLRYWRFLLLAVTLAPLSQFFFAPAPSPPAGAAPYFMGTITVDAVSAGSAAHSWHWLVWAWVAGAAVLLARWTVGFLQLRRLKRRARFLSATEAGAGRLCEELGIHPAFFLSERVQGPVTFGWRRPAVLLPGDFASLSPGARLTVLTHELMHVARRDWLWLLAEEAFSVLFWFHPAVWLIQPRIALTREQAVDFEVVRLSGERRPYMQALVAMARRRQGAAAVGSLPFQRRSHLLQRMAFLAQEDHMSRKRLAATAAVLFLALSFAGFVAVRAFPLRGDEGIRSGAKTAPDQNKIYDLVPGMTPPKLVEKVAPVYPEKLKKKKVAGTVVLRVVIGKTGRIEAMKVMKSTDLLFTKAAEEAVSQWVYEPVKIRGTVVRVHQYISIRFALDHDAKKAPPKAGKST